VGTPKETENEKGYSFLFYGFTDCRNLLIGMPIIHENDTIGIIQSSKLFVDRNISLIAVSCPSKICIKDSISFSPRKNALDEVKALQMIHPNGDCINNGDTITLISCYQ